MAASGLRETLDVEYIYGSKFNSKAAQVHLFPRGDRYKLQVAKQTEKKCKILEEVWVENIGALVVTQLKNRKYVLIQGRTVGGLRNQAGLAACDALKLYDIKFCD